MKTLIVIDMQNDFIDCALGTPEAQADANKKLAESLTDEVLAKMYYERWNGVLPNVYGSDGMIIQIPEK
jgi:nicotinamidase-related amidase